MSTFTNFNGPENNCGSLYLQKQIDALKSAISGIEGNLETYKYDLETLAEGISEVVNTQSVRTKALRSDRATVDVLNVLDVASENVVSKKVKVTESEVKDELVTGNVHFVPEWKSAVTCNHYHILAKLDDKERAAITFVRSSDANDVHPIKATVIWSSDSIAAVYSHRINEDATVRYGVYFDGKETFLVLYGFEGTGINGSTIFGNVTFEAASINALNVTENIHLDDEHKVVEINASNLGGFNAAPFKVPEIQLDKIKSKAIETDEATSAKAYIGAVITDDVRGTDNTQLLFNDSAIEVGDETKQLILKSNERPRYGNRYVALLHDVDGIGFLYMGSHTAFMAAPPTVDEIPINESDKYTFKDDDTVLVGDPAINKMKLFKRVAGHWDEGVDITIDNTKTYQYYVHFQNYDNSGFWVPANIIWNMSIAVAPYIFVNEFPIEDMYTKGQVDNKNNALRKEMQNADKAEENARIEAIENEKQERINAVDGEKQAREAGDTNLSNRIDALTQATTQNLQDAIATEKNERTMKDASLQQAIDEEKSRAQGAEATLTQQIQQETQSRTQSEAVISQQITNETQARAAKDIELEQKIQQALQGANTAIEQVSDRITELDTAYKQADTTLDGKITALDTAYKQADTAITNRIAGFETNTNNQIQALATNKLDKVVDVTPKDQMYVKKADGTQAMIDVGENAALDPFAYAEGVHV